MMWGMSKKQDSPDVRDTPVAHDNPFGFDVTTLPASLVAKLAQIVVHAYSLVTYQPGKSEPVDRRMILSLIDDREVQEWMAAMQAADMSPPWPTP